MAEARPDLSKLYELSFENSVVLKSLLQRVDRHSIENKTILGRINSDISSIRNRQQSDKEELIKEIHALENKINEFDKQSKVDDAKLNVKIVGMSGTVGAIVSGLVTWLKHYAP